MLRPVQSVISLRGQGGGQSFCSARFQHFELHAQLGIFFENGLNYTENYMHRQNFTCTEQILHAFVHVKPPKIEHWVSARGVVAPLSPPLATPPALFTSVCHPMHGRSCPKSQFKSTCLTAKFGSFLDHAETGEKGQNVISSSVQHLISLIFAIHLSFIIPTNDVDFVDKAYLEICDHSLFTMQFY